MSEEFAQCTEEWFEYENRGLIQVKGKGEMKTRLLKVCRRKRRPGRGF